MSEQNKASSVSETPSTPCPACQPAKEAGAKFCPQCGCRLAPLAVAVRLPQPGVASPQPPHQEPPPPTNKNVSVVAVGGDGLDGEGNGQELPVQLLQHPGTVPPVAAGCDCGRDLPEDAGFCPGCGKKVPQTEAPQYVIQCQSPAGKRSHPWAGGELTIGKAADCGLVVVGDEYLSRRHTRLVARDGQVFLEDLGSSNGTFLKIRRPVAVEIGDEILVGTCLLRLERTNP